MDTHFNFNSAICTSREQSERLLKLGLKKETADFYTPIKLNPDKGSLPCPPDFWTSDEPFIKKVREASIPAWNLHRLIEMCDINPFIFYTNCGYDNVVDRIEELIKEGDFNKEYLEVLS